MDQEKPWIDLVSIIIPVYNTKIYLREALESVIHQSYQNLEVIIIDDGSTDGSGEICDQYEAQDRRIRVIHQDNRGLSAARNAGLEEMTGQAVMFLDSDDAYHPEIVQALLEAMNREQADVVLCKFADYRTDTEMSVGIINDKMNVPVAPEGVYDRIHALRALADVQINVSVWNKLYRRELWNAIRFPDGHVFEDSATMFHIFDLAGKVYVIDRNLYMHRIHAGSITASWSECKLRDWGLASSRCESFVRSHMPGIFSQEQMNRIRQIGINTMIDGYLWYSLENGDKGNDFCVEMREHIFDSIRRAGPENLSFKTKAAWRMLCFCPWLLKMIYVVLTSHRRGLPDGEQCN